PMEWIQAAPRPCHHHRFPIRLVRRPPPSGTPPSLEQTSQPRTTLMNWRWRLIKNCIICSNYLYLSQKLEEITDTESREALLDAVAHGSTVAWRHLNLLGEYDFSDEKLQDTVGIKPPKLADQRETFLGPAKRTELPGRNGLR